MPYLNDSNEWRLLDELGRLLDQRKARYHVPEEPPSDHKRVGPYPQLIEVELRCVFMVKQIPQDLDQADFGQCQAKLKSLCLLLDDLVLSPKAYGGPEHEGLAYPRLRALTRLLESTPGKVDLAYGPNKTLFKLPYRDDELRECYKVITDYTDVLRQLLKAPSQESIILPLQKQQKKKIWEKAIIRNRAKLVLKTLFKYFKCEAPHEVLLQLIENPDEDLIPNLQLMLSPCLELQFWQEARYDFVNLQSSILSISDICMNLRQHTGQGKALVLHIKDIKEFDLFGAWSSSTSPMAGPSLNESLDQLILRGFFRPFDINECDEALPVRFSIKDRRALAVTLGFCLMNFFDADLTSSRIHFLGPKPYLAFNSELPVTTNSENFLVGHPALLSFAKLLLEMEYGQNMDINISPNNSENGQAWFQLMHRLELLERERNDVYVEAIRGCLTVHYKIASALRLRGSEHKDVDSIIRKNLYMEIVYKLMIGHEHSQNGYTHARKRRRQDSSSSSSSDSCDGAQACGSTRMAVRLERTTPEYKKRRIPGPQVPPAVSGSIHREASNLYNGNTPAQGLADSSRTISSVRPSHRDDFEIAIICALKLEYDAVSYIFDEFWDDHGDPYGKAAGDHNIYTTGRMGDCNVVLALLPQIGKASAASAAASMRSSYRGLRLALLTGVCGSVPHRQYREIFLGDVVISKTVLQHDFGWQYSDGFIRKNTVEDNLSRPNKDVRSLVTIFETDRGRDQLEQLTAHFLRQLQANAALKKRQGKYDYPGTAEDKLFKSTHRHKHHVSPTCICRDCFNDSDPVCDKALSSSCADLGCDDGRYIARKRLQAMHQLENDRGDNTPQPAVYVGAVASGDKVIKSAAERDKLSTKADVIAFEMEGAGVWDEVPCIVVKGVCNYADSHKHERWQNFAAASASAATRAILARYIRTDKL